LNAVIYCRVSSRDQVDGTSLESQESACREYARKHNLTIARVFIEEGESAKYADRTQLLELLTFCKKTSNNVEVMLVWKVDRFARNVEDHYAIKGALRKVGVRVVSVTEPIEGDATGRLMETILAGFAQFDNDIRAMRTVQGMQQRLKDGIWPWEPPLGYLPPKIGKKTEPDRPDPRRFRAVQRAWEFMATGAYTKAEIVRLFHEWGVQTLRRRPLTPQSLDHMFDNRYYMGVLRDPWTGQEYRGGHKAMVSEDTFNKVQDVIHGRAKKVPHRLVNENFPLRGFVRCPTCDQPMTGAFAHGKRRPYAYYMCFRRHCATRTKSYPVPAVHGEFEQALAQASVAPELAYSLVAAIVDATADSSKDAAAAIERRQAETERLNAQIQELISMRAEQLISDDEFVAQRDRLRRRLGEMRPDNVSAAPLTVSRSDIEMLCQAFADLTGTWRTAPVTAQRVLSRVLLPDGFVLGGGKTPRKGLVFAISRGSSAPSKTLAALVRENLNTLVDEINALLSIIRRDKPAVKKAA
jgi:DNA invertase Pin-like site-specific DNA recombinase